MALEGAGGEAPDGPTILMLHGWTQNDTVFAGRTHAWRKKLKDFRLVFACAPHMLPPSDACDRPNARAWWYYSKDVITDTSDLFSGAPREYHGWDESRAHLMDVWRVHKPVAVVGFSQGAVAVHRLCIDFVRAGGGGGVTTKHTSLAAAMAPMLASPPAAIILVCGFPASPLPLLEEGDAAPVARADGASGGAGTTAADGAATPTTRLPFAVMHVIGVDDTVVPPTYQRQLAASVGCDRDGATVLEVAMGHTMPQRSGDMAAIAAFLNTAMAATP